MFGKDTPSGAAPEMARGFSGGVAGGAGGPAGTAAQGSGTGASRGGFLEVLGRYLQRLEGLRYHGASEDSMRDALLGFLREAFPRLEAAEPILLEKHIPALKVRGGYADALYGDLVFECKKRLDDRTRAEGVEELERYLRNQQHPEQFFGILTDGQRLEVFALREDKLLLVDRLVLGPERAEEAWLWLDSYLFHERNLQPTAEDVALRFGERSAVFFQSFRTLEGLWREVAASPNAQTKIVQWQSLLSIVYGSAVGDPGLFLRHTYLALLARALAFVALCRRSPQQEELSGMVTGETFGRMGLDNFVGDDFFSWVAMRGVADRAMGLLHALASRLAVAYDLSAIREDLLKELYQELVDPATRHDLGEFYTPDWLAELTLRHAGFPGQRKVAAEVSLLDPSCGSGTFLFTAVRMLREAGWHGALLAGWCTEHLAGLDVHPLAVTIAKTNLLLALGAELKGYAKRFTLPIYMADSLTSSEGGTTHPEVQIRVPVEELAQRAGKARPRGLPSSFGLPAQLSDQPALLGAALDTLLEFATLPGDPASVRRGFRQRLEQLGITEAQQHQWEANLDLMRWLLEPPATDSVWRFILRNACQPEFLARRKFKFVVGNPPWLSYRYIRRKEYQERVRRLSSRYALVDRTRAHLFTQMELATLFFAVCAHRYLAEDGTQALVMPRSVLTGAKQHAEFRNRYIWTSRLLIDCEQVAPLFNVPACVVIWRKGAERGTPPAPAGGVTMLRLKGTLPRRNLPLGQAEQHIRATEHSYAPLAAATASWYWSRVTQGASIAPRCAWFVRPPEEALVVDRHRPQLETDPSIQRQAKPPWKGQRVLGSVESDFLFATLLSDDMLPFGWRRLLMVVLPVLRDHEGRLELLKAKKAIELGRAGLAQWLLNAEALWQQHARSGSRVETIYDRLDFSRCLTRQKPVGCYKVLYNSQGTHLCSCVVDAHDGRRWRVGKIALRGFVADYVTYWFETDSDAEAHYLCAVLNAPRVDQAIKPYQTKGLFGAGAGRGERHIHRRPFEVLPIPRFEPKDHRHTRLAEISQRCHEKVSQFLATAEQKQLHGTIGRLRTRLRRELLAKELEEIDNLVTAILAD